MGGIGTSSVPAVCVLTNCLSMIYVVGGDTNNGGRGISIVASLRRRIAA